MYMPMQVVFWHVGGGGNDDAPARFWSGRGVKLKNRGHWPRGILWLPVLRTQRNIASGWHVVPVFCNSRDRNVIYTIAPPHKPEKATPVSPVTLAFAFQRMLDNGEVNNQAELANKVGLTRARITQLLNLLKLPDAIIQELGSSCEEEQIAFYTERRLRPITQLRNTKRQIAAFRRLGSQIGVIHQCDFSAC
jgi:hypothetical protein